MEGVLPDADAPAPGQPERERPGAVERESTEGSACAAGVPLRPGNGWAILNAEFILGLIANLLIARRYNPSDGRFVSGKRPGGVLSGENLEIERVGEKRERPDFHPAFPENKALLGLFSSLRWLLSPVIRCGATDIRRYFTHGQLHFCIATTPSQYQLPNSLPVTSTGDSAEYV